MAFNLKMESELMSTPLNHRTQRLTLTLLWRGPYRHAETDHYSCCYKPLQL
jgi:hypothetical protein